MLLLPVLSLVTRVTVAGDGTSRSLGRQSSVILETSLISKARLLD